MDLPFLTATALRRLIQRREVSCREVLDAHLVRIDEVDPHLGAIVTRCDDRARADADRLDDLISRGEDPGPLAGLPVAHKDLFPVAGLRTTFGSRLFEHHVPDETALVVERLQRTGAVTIGKTNTPEWGAGSQTFNDVFGATRNPYDLTKTCGGSSGGAATALAARLVPIADGSDMGGSLRNPAGFCNVVGLRPSPGRVPNPPDAMAWSTLGVAGPMARTVADCALMLSAIAGPDSRAPLSIDEPGALFTDSLDRDHTYTRVAISPDFDGQLPVARETREIVARAGDVFNDLGCLVEPACPRFIEADEVFKTLRAFQFASSHGDGVREHPDMYKSSVVWNVEQGLALSAMDVARAEKKRTQLYQHVSEFMDTWEFLILPVSQVPPFPVDVEWVESIEGETMETYIDWMKSCYFISVLGLPAISIPGGFTGDGLPVGIQIVARWHRELDLLRIAHAFEAATKHGERLPPEAG